MHYGTRLSRESHSLNFGRNTCCLSLLCARSCIKMLRKLRLLLVLMILMGCPTIQGEELVTKVADEASKVTMEDKNGLVKRQGNKGDFYGYEYDYETTADTDPYLAVKYKNVAQTESYSPVPTYGYATRYKGNDLYGRYQKAPVPTDVYTTTQPSAKRLTYQAYHHQLPAYTSTGQENSMEVDQTTSSSIFRNMLSQVYKPKMIDRIGAAAAAMGSGILIPLIALGALLPFTLMPITITITPEQTRKKREVDQHFFPSPTLNSSWRFSADDLEAPVESTEWQDRIEMALQHFELVSHSLGIHPANLGGAILDDVMAKYLQCSGLLGAELGCLERMVCMQECYAQQLDRNDKKIIETIIRNLLQNSQLPRRFRRRIVRAIRVGRKGDDMACLTYKCEDSSLDHLLIPQNRIE